jgi:hypothetical protein
MPPAQADQTRGTPGSGCTKEMGYVRTAIGMHQPMRERIAIDLL